MKRTFILSNFFAAMSVVLASLVAAPSDAMAASIVTKYTFSNTTPLATGKWVRISLTGSGVFEISDAELLEMGFDDPSKVVVYGLGGLGSSGDTVNAAGRNIVDDTVQPIPMMRVGDRLLFYSTGDRTLKYSSYQPNSSDIFPGFIRENQNSTSYETYYMLTDSHVGADMEIESAANTGAAEELETVHSYVYHEKDIYNGTNRSGKQWWGEHMAEGAPLEFDIRAKYYKPEGRVRVCSDIVLLRGQEGTLNIKLNDVPYEWNLQRSTSRTFSWHNSGALLKLNPDPATGDGLGTLSFIVSRYPDWATLNLEYFTVVYPISLDNADADQDFTQINLGANLGLSSNWKIKMPERFTVWNVTNPLKPVSLYREGDYVYSNKASLVNLVAFDSSKHQKRINSFEAIPNRNLHALQYSGPYDFIIFTVPSLKPYAEKIAELHAQYDNIRTAVVTHQEVFDEFTGGTPEASAYRMMAKMLYQKSGGRLKNVLFLGPVHGDYRNIYQAQNRVEGHIAYQDHLDNIEDISNLAMDYYGVMVDNLSMSPLFASIPVTLGVGLLPIDSMEEGEIAVTKIRNYLEKKDFSGMVNESYSIGCRGDSHVHENQSIAIGNKIQEYAQSLTGAKFAHESLWLDAMTDDQGRDRIQHAMGRGKTVLIYYGHAGPQGFKGLTSMDAVTAGNNELGLAYFAGCDLYHPDTGLHGMGSLPVIRSLGGFIGTVGSTRTVMSNHNETLCLSFVNAMFKDRDNLSRTVSPSYGEVFAQAKDACSNNSEICYVYTGDPALIMPVATTPVSLSISNPSGLRAGDVVTVEGQVKNSDGSLFETYNGYVTLKLMEPTRWVVTTVPEGASDTSKMEDYAINDLPILAVRGTVKHGKFSVKVPLPDKVDSFLSDDGENLTYLPILAGTWDPTTRIGGAGETSFSTAMYDEETSDERKDVTAPIMALLYDEDLRVITAKAMDEVALVPGIGNGAGIELLIDGNPISVSHDQSVDVAVTSFETNVDVEHLALGNHTATARATDLLGNCSEETKLVFTISAATPLTLEVDSPVAVDEASFKLSAFNDDSMRLVVAKADGTIVSDTEVDARSFTLDTTGFETGTYRAAVRSNSAKGNRVFSNHVEFTVID